MAGDTVRRLSDGAGSISPMWMGPGWWCGLVMQDGGFRFRFGKLEDGREQIGRATSPSRFAVAKPDTPLGRDAGGRLEVFWWGGVPPIVCGRCCFQGTSRCHGTFSSSLLGRSLGVLKHANCAWTAAGGCGLGRVGPHFKGWAG